MTPEGAYTKTPTEVYAARLIGLSGRLHQLAEQVLRLGHPTTSPTTLRPDHVKAALHVQKAVLQGVADLGLNELIVQAEQADHPDANRTPGALLGVATGAAEDVLAGASTTSALSGIEVAEAVLRAVGLMR